METILFYEKPGCQNNIRQKKILELSGHVVESVNLLEHPWTKEELEHYLGEKPVADCFNPAAPVIKSGLVDPFDFTKEEALEEMIKEPLLIKRPLLKIGNHYIQGFDTAVLGNLINLKPVQGAENIVAESSISDLNSCPHIDNSSCINQEY
jgi:nitrogenase-associated protein